MLNKVNKLSYAEMETSENNFDFDYNQSAKVVKMTRAGRIKSEGVGDAEQVT